MSDQVRVDERQCVAVATVSGELDVTTVDDVREAIRRGVQPTHTGLILDLSEVSSVDGAGVSLLFAMQRAVAGRGLAVRMVLPRHPPARRRLLQPRLPAPLESHETMQAALASAVAAALARSFATIASRLFADSVEGTLQRIVDVAAQALGACDDAGVTIARGERMHAAAATNPLVFELDGLQYRTGEGPCLDALHEGGAVAADNLRIETRWPLFAGRAIAMGFAGVLSYRLLAAEDTLGVLSLYSRAPGAFQASTQEAGAIFAEHATIALVEARAQDMDRQQAEGLRQALASRDVIGQAKGILMEREQIGAEEAFDMLRRVSQTLNVKLTELARQVTRINHSSSP